MALPKANSDLISPADYLTGENDGSVRHEYIDGRVFAMAGASERHSIIKLNVAGIFNQSVTEPCRVFDGDMKLEVNLSTGTRFYYPDIFVSCAPGDQGDYVRRDAVLVIEILSPSTARVDRYEKFASYMSLPMLQEYVLIDQSVPLVEVFRRRSAWEREAFRMGTSVTFESVKQTMTLDQIYRRITF